MPVATIKTHASDFVVDEIPAYEPCGEGEHLFVHFRKTGLNTLHAVRRIAEALGVEGKNAGFAGMKDRHAVTTQWASFPFPMARGEAPDIHVDDVEILEVRRHRNKLKTGHLRGNRFTLTLREVDDRAALAERLELAGRRGVPNAFGPQRFGRHGDNAQVALAWLRGERKAPRGQKEKRLYVSALQSQMFNEVLSRRSDSWDRVLVGDLAQKHDSGGIFHVDEATHADASERAERGEVSATGPMFGPKMKQPSGEPDRIEQEVLSETLGDVELLRPVARLAQGTRRSLRLPLSEMNVSERSAPDVLVASFVLPKGGYATTVLAHVCDVQTAVTPTPRPA